MSLKISFKSNELNKKIDKKYILSDKLNDIVHVIENMPHFRLQDFIGLTYKDFIMKLLNVIFDMRPQIDSYVYKTNFVRFWSDIRKPEEITLKSDIQLILYFIIKLEFMNIPEDYLVMNHP
jgi:hypothetical protein